MTVHKTRQLFRDSSDVETAIGILNEVSPFAAEMAADHATIIAHEADLKSLVNEVRNLILYMPLGNPGFVIDTNFDIKNGNAISYLNGGTLKTLSANTSFDTGTSAVIAADKWGVAVLSVSSAAAATVTWFTASGAGYASEAAAIAAITGLTATDTVLGYATVQTASGQSFTAGTDALQGGTGGNPSADTNYYNLINPNSELLGAAVSTSPPATLTATTPTGDTVGDEYGTAR